MQLAVACLLSRILLICWWDIYVLSNPFLEAREVSLPPSWDKILPPICSYPFEIKDVDKGGADADVGAFGDAMGLGTPAVRDEDGGAPNWC